MAEQTTLEKHPQYEATIGIEVHVQLSTKSKIFCSCPNIISAEPNKNICPVCAGYPGVLPVLNKQVVHHAILMGLATHSKITTTTTFSRKHYFYPDLPKNYQITQDADPICTEGFVSIKTTDGHKKIRLTRIHMEEDAGKNIHSTTTNESFVDLNRCGTPLLEIVTYPDISSADEARAYLKTLRNIVLHLDIGTGNMEDGAFRADTNISVRKKGAEKLGTKVELKNINSFKFISDAIEYEIERQIETLESGSRIFQETRLWNTHEKKTFSMRAKEEAADYRYFQEPDLPIIEISADEIESIKNSLPELPDEKLKRFLKADLSAYEAQILIDDISLSRYFDEAFKIYQSKNLINWILRNLIGFIKEQKITLEKCPITPSRLAELVQLVDEGIINTKVAQEIFEELGTSAKSPRELVKEKGLEQIDSDEELKKIAREIITQNPKQVEQYKGGNERLFGFFVGQAMKATQGKANPQKINLLFKELLA
jgi:aspartyl-tRNA(Asn)/glutamyl-tRNA(Gln) amidotransferase subunit B